MRLLSAVVLVALLAASAGCSKQIGDSCSTNVECSPNGDRVCDPSQPGGYCTQEDCIADTCPQESVCVRYLALSSTACYSDQGLYQCTSDDICLEGFCAPLRSARSACLLTCGG